VPERDALLVEAHLLSHRRALFARWVNALSRLGGGRGAIAFRVEGWGVKRGVESATAPCLHSSISSSPSSSGSFK
jgi:hypothetical protein